MSRLQMMEFRYGSVWRERQKRGRGGRASLVRARARVSGCVYGARAVQRGQNTHAARTVCTAQHMEMRAQPKALPAHQSCQSGAPLHAPLLLITCYYIPPLPSRFTNSSTRELKVNRTPARPDGMDDTSSIITLELQPQQQHDVLISARRFLLVIEQRQI
jgi:hypothetical protein